MKTKCSVYIAASLDGYIARKDGDIEWLHRPEYSKSELKGLSFAEFISSVDALVMGRKTFEKVLSFADWPYAELPVVVLTTGELAIPDQLQGKVTAMGGDPGEVVASLEKQGKEHLYIDGGKTIQGFLQAGLIHEITLTMIPILLGEGIPLFGSLTGDLPLHLVDASSSPNGFVQLRYEVALNR
jgi:dihydrofolate reductase